MAAYRAQETERSDAVFKDPFARRLAGERGEQIIRQMRAATHGTWALVVRTKVLDDLISEQVAGGQVDAVVNLAAGLDARPWRMELPASLRWVDVDLPDILAYKANKLAGEAPRCRYEARTVDLANATARRAAFARLAEELGRVLVVTEGLLVYLTAEQVGALARDLRAHPAFRLWLMELVNPVVLRAMQRMWSRDLGKANASMHFGPEESGAFFAPFGWREREFRSFVDASISLKREMPAPLSWFVRVGMRMAWPSRREKLRRYSGAVLLDRSEVRR